MASASTSSTSIGGSAIQRMQASEETQLSQELAHLSLEDGTSKKVTLVERSGRGRMKLIPDALIRLIGSNLEPLDVVSFLTTRKDLTVGVLMTHHDFMSMFMNLLIRKNNWEVDRVQRKLGKVGMDEPRFQEVCRSITELDLQDKGELNPLIDSNLEAIVESFPSLRAMNVTNQGSISFGSFGGLGVRSLANLRHLQKLILVNNQRVSEQEGLFLKFLTAMAKNGTLKHLDMRKTSCTAALFCLDKQPQLERLFFTLRNDTNQTFTELPNLRELEGSFHIFEGASLPQLEKLTTITDASKLNVQNLPNLQELTVQGQSLDVDKLAPFTKLRFVKCTYFHASKVSALSLPNLRELHIETAFDLTDRTIQLLFQCIELRKLCISKVLNMMAPLSEKGVLALVEHLPYLEELFIGGGVQNKEAVAKQLQEKFPKLKIQ